MIGPLRARHRAVFAVLSIALPAAFAWALVARDDEREPDALPPTIADDGPQLGDVRAISVVVHEGREVRVTLGNAGVIAIELVSGPPAPDVLAYWCARAPESTELPTDAVLLGSLGLRQRRFESPATAGAIVLFSLAHFEVIASVPLAP